jgi:ElaB/YqjD/DUF883 family membrane-anchored ribosome-binding protein
VTVNCGPLPIILHRKSLGCIGIGVSAKMSFLPRFLSAIAIGLAIPVELEAQQQPVAMPSPTRAESCQKPDESLLKAHGGYGDRALMPDADRIEMYNKQAKQFNDCTQSLIDNRNAEIDKIRAEGNSAIQAVADTGNRELGDIQSKIQKAIAGDLPDTMDVASNEASAWQFPYADCRKPDKSLLRPIAKNSKNTLASSIERTGKYDSDRQKFEVCVRDYINQATSEIKQIQTSADAQMHQIASEANNKINVLRATVKGVIATANAAAEVETQIVSGTPLALNSAPIANLEISHGVENVTVEGTRIERVDDTPKGDGNPDAIVCRKPQQRADSRLLGPEICKRNRVWAALYKSGMDISSDGTAIVPSEAYRTTNKTGMNCVKITTGGGYQGTMTNEYCN